MKRLRHQLHFFEQTYKTSSEGGCYEINANFRETSMQFIISLFLCNICNILTLTTTSLCTALAGQDSVLE